MAAETVITVIQRNTVDFLKPIQPNLAKRNICSGRQTDWFPTAGLCGDLRGGTARAGSCQCAVHSPNGGNITLTVMSLPVVLPMLLSILGLYPHIQKDEKTTISYSKKTQTICLFNCGPRPGVGLDTGKMLQAGVCYV